MEQQADTKTVMVVFQDGLEFYSTTHGYGGPIFRASAPVGDFDMVAAVEARSEFEKHMETTQPDQPWRWEDSEWCSVDRDEHHRSNDTMADGGEAAIRATNRLHFEEDPESAAKDTVCDICHALGRKGWTEEQIKELLRSALETHYHVEKDGAE